MACPACAAPAQVLGSLQQCWGLHHTLPPQDQKLPSTYGKHTVLSICVRSFILCPKIWHCLLSLLLKKRASPPLPPAPWRHHYHTGFSWVLVPKQHLKSVLFEMRSIQICNWRKSNEQKQTCTSPCIINIQLLLRGRRVQTAH